MNKTQSERIGKIEQLKSILKKVKTQKREIKPQEFILQVMSTMRVSAFTAKEYIRQAQFELERKK